MPNGLKLNGMTQLTPEVIGKSQPITQSGQKDSSLNGVGRFEMYAQMDFNTLFADVKTPFPKASQ